MNEAEQEIYLFMKAVMTVIGNDKVGIIAGVTNILASLNINILDLSQTIMTGLFTMTILVDTSKASVSLAEINDRFNEYGKENDLSIRIQNAEIFNAMHKV